MARCRKGRGWVECIFQDSHLRGRSVVASARLFPAPLHIIGTGGWKLGSQGPRLDHVSLA